MLMRRLSFRLAVIQKQSGRHLQEAYTDPLTALVTIVFRRISHILCREYTHIAYICNLASDPFCCFDCCLGCVAQVMAIYVTSGVVQTHECLEYVRVATVKTFTILSIMF